MTDMRTATDNRMTSEGPPGSPDYVEALSKVPPVTLAFWIVKIFATTLGETGGDALSMSLDLGYAVSTLIFLAFFIVTLIGQVASRHYHPVFYWAVVAATTTVGTTTSDYIDRTLGLGYVKSSAMLLALVIILLVIWRAVTGHIVVDHVIERRDEIFYWVTILVSNTLGTALGDFTAETGLGFQGGALVFAALLAFVAEADAGNPGGLAFVEALSIGLARQISLHAADPQRVERVRGGLSGAAKRRTLEIMDEHLDADLSVELLAREVGLSPAHFSRAFKESTGRAPHRYLLTLRLEKARRLLEAPAPVLADVAQRSGFSDQAHLTRLFKREYGVTPGAMLRGKLKTAQ
jgi:uncharacterized membrane-anchored protein/AraC-like DNA-binding protein